MGQISKQRIIIQCGKCSEIKLFSCHWIRTEEKLLIQLGNQERLPLKNQPNSSFSAQQTLTSYSILLTFSRSSSCICLHTLSQCLSWAVYHVFLKLFCNNLIRSPTIMPAMEEGRTSLAQTCLGDVADMNPHLPARTLSHNAPSVLLFKTKINSYKAPRTVPCMH